MFPAAVLCSFYSSFGVYILMENISNDSLQFVASASSVSPCSTLPTLINLRYFAHPANNVLGIAVDYRLSCWFWNNAIAHSHRSNAFLVYMSSNYPIFFKRPGIRLYGCHCAYFSNTIALFHFLLIGDLVFNLNPGPN